MPHQLLLGQLTRFGNQHNFFALTLIGHRHGGMRAIGHKACRQFFDRGQRYHFAADFGEALGAAQDTDKTIFIYVDDVAGIIPFALRLDDAGLVGLKITQHHVRPFDEQPPAALQPFDFFDAALDGGQQRAPPSPALCSRGVLTERNPDWFR